MSEPVKPSVPPTAYAVMALLHHGGDLSGYDIRRWAEQSLRHFYWTPAQSQIYRELARLDDLGWVTATEVNQTGRPDKTVYELTSAGNEALAGWVRDPDVERLHLKHPTALRVFVGDVADESTLRGLLAAHIGEVERQLDNLEELLVGLDGHHGARFARAVAEWGVEIYRADRRGALDLLEVLGDLYDDVGSAPED